MKILLTFLALSLSTHSCIKGREEYKKAIEEIQKEESKDERERGSNDAEGMGMDE